MPITIKKGIMKYREPNGDYKGLDGISQEYTTQQIEAIQSAGQTQISNINSVLQEAKESGEFDGPQGPKGDTGDIGPQGPQGIPGITAIDDTSGSGDTDKTWSADKLVSEFSDLENAIPTVPTKVSQFENDSGYLTQHQDISNKADKTDIPTKVSELTNDSGYLTSETDPTVPAWAKAAQKPTYTASEVGALASNTHIPSTTAELTNDAGFITSSALPTKVSDLTNDAGYLTQHQDISGKANSADLAAVATSGDYADLSNKPTIPTVPVQDVQVNGVSVLNDGTANIPIASASDPGVVKAPSGKGVYVDADNDLAINPAGATAIKQGTAAFLPIVPVHQAKSVFYGLAKAAGHDEKNSVEPVGTYTPEAKAAIQSMLNVPSKTDTQLDTTLSRGRKENTTVGASSFAFGDNVQASGLVSHAEGRGTTASGELAHAEGNYAKAYGFASHAEGNYTEASGNSSHVEGYGTVASGELSHAEGSQTVAIGPHSHAEGHNNYRLSTNAYEINDQQYNLNYGAVGTADHSEGYDTIADSTLGGTLNDSYAAHAEGVGTIAVANAQHAQGKWNAPDTNFADVVGNGTENARSNAYALTWSGDGKFAGNVYVGCGDDSSGGTMLPKDVQIDGTSVVDQNGVANVPKASSSVLGVIKVNGDLSYTGIGINNGLLHTVTASDTELRRGLNNNRPVTPINQHTSTFYALAKVAGDTTQAQSDNAVGIYTDEAKQAIQTMLGIDLSSIASQVEIPLVETVDGAAVTITGQPNTRYMCGEVTSISITPPAAGSIDVVFTSGSTVAVLTLPSTVKMPEWFDASTLDTNTVYEILITDGVYGSVMTWAT